MHKLGKKSNGMTGEIRINPYRFQIYFETFKDFVHKKSGMAFESFASNLYTVNQENYKYDIYNAARAELAFETWNKLDIGSGNIVAAVIKAIELDDNNLVTWQAKFGDKARPHHQLFESKNNVKVLESVETCLFNLYHEPMQPDLFDNLVEILGKKYPLMAYLFFIRDRSKYLPLAPTYFDKTFELLGADFKTAHLCSWDNYSIYISLMGEIKSMLADALSTEVTLLDAHSFAWMLSAQMSKENKLPDIPKNIELRSKERATYILARNGQGAWRKSLLNFWSGCAVTHCKNPGLLTASHIKPWAKSDIKECIDLYNGLLLSPALDRCFDSGFISFDDNGNIIISESLTKSDTTALNIDKEMKLAKIDSRHQKYLAYHRDNIFNKK